MARLPAAPGPANGQPPRPPAELSIVVTPSSSAASTFASACAARVVEVQRRALDAATAQDRLEHAFDVARRGHADRVAEAILVAAEVDQRPATRRRARGSTAPSYGQPNAAET